MTDTPHEDRACARCGSSGGTLLDIDTGSVCHAEPYQCIHWLRVDSAALRDELQKKNELVRSLCEELGGHECNGKCSTFGIDSDCPAENLRAAWDADKAELAALRADKERLSTACASAIAEGRKRVDQSLREFGYDSMEFAECRAAWHSCIGGLRAHIDQDTVTAWMRSAAAIDLEALRADKERLDWLEGLEYKGRGWVVRDSATGRGWRLHVSETRMGSHPSVRAAIDHARGAE